MENEVMYIKLDDIIPNRFQPREVFEEEALQKLADSIRQHGVIEPILVRPVSNKYEIIAGERRYKASVLAGLTKIPAIIKPMDDKESSIIAYIENEHRSDVSAIEEARTIDRILKSNNMTQEELAKELGINQSTLANKLRLLSLPSEIQDSLMHNEISERHARSLLSVKDVAKQIELLKKIKEKRMSVRELDSEIKGMNNVVNDFVSDDGSSENIGMSEFMNVPPLTQSMQDFNKPQNDIYSGVSNNTQNSFINPSPTNDFMSYLDGNNSNPAPTEPSTPSSTGEDPGFMDFLNSYDNNNPVTDTLPKDENSKPEDNGFMDFLNSYDNNNPVEESNPKTPDFLNNPPLTNVADENPDTGDGGFMDFLNSYDDKNPLPSDNSIDKPIETLAINQNINNIDSFNDNSYLNNNFELPNDNNVLINNVTPPITSDFSSNSYIEDNPNFVDVSKNTVLGSVDQIIDKLKVVVDDIKARSKFKVDTDEINYDDIYQITIKIDKRDF